MGDNYRNYLVATIKSWNIEGFDEWSEQLDGKWHLITDHKELTLDNLNKINPEIIFFPHWSWIIPAEIYQSFECVIFHMADLPYGRGGSPLQNLIVRGHTDTMISALRCSKNVDAGPVYMKTSLSLLGTAEEIFIRAGKKIRKMIEFIIKDCPEAREQVGEVIEFKRRKPSEGDIGKLKSLEETYNYIRMLDGEGYPRAFFETEDLRFEFSRASLKHGRILADVKITEKK